MVKVTWRCWWYGGYWGRAKASLPRRRMSLLLLLLSRVGITKLLLLLLILSSIASHTCLPVRVEVNGDQGYKVVVVAGVAAGTVVVVIAGAEVSVLAWVGLIAGPVYSVHYALGKTRPVKTSFKQAWVIFWKLHQVPNFSTICGNLHPHMGIFKIANFTNFSVSVHFFSWKNSIG